MKITKELYGMFIDKKINVVCTDGDVLTGVWIDHTSELDNEPDGESITIERADGALIEIYVAEIERIELAKIERIERVA